MFVLPWFGFDWWPHCLEQSRALVSLAPRRKVIFVYRDQLMWPQKLCRHAKKSRSHCFLHSVGLCSPASLHIWPRLNKQRRNVSQGTDVMMWTGREIAHNALTSFFLILLTKKQFFNFYWSERARWIVLLILGLVVHFVVRGYFVISDCVHIVWWDVSPLATVQHVAKQSATTGTIQ